jgi:hypothetical protein
MIKELEMILELIRSGGEGAYSLTILYMIKDIIGSILIAGTVIWIVSAILRLIKYGINKYSD